MSFSSCKWKQSTSENIADTSVDVYETETSLLYSRRKIYILKFLLGILDQQAAYEVLCQLTGVTEILFVEVVVDARDVGQGLLLGLAQERRSAAQATGADKRIRVIRTTWRRREAVYVAADVNNGS